MVSQFEPYHAFLAASLKADIENQVLKAEGRRPQIHLTHEDFPFPGAWTIIPLLKPLVIRYKSSNVRWVLFFEPHTAVRYEKLLEALAEADKQPDIRWIGYPLGDGESTIIHHYKEFKDLEEEGGFVYPNLANGFAMTLQLMKELINQIEAGERRLDNALSIDASFELAILVYGDGSNPGPLLSADRSFCIVAADYCAVYPKQFKMCDSAIPERTIIFAVKTWSGFHATRVKVVKKTWGRHVTNLRFYSDADDPSLPAEDTGVPNEPIGSCTKTIAILKMVLKRVKTMPDVKWIFLADDDTILGVQRLCEVLSCYYGGGHISVLGERYGYGYGKKETAAKGYDYITLGGGAALSIAAAEALSKCACPAYSAPDDMVLGVCARSLNITLTHSSLFHQNQPQAYPRELLARDRPVSFHGHLQDPVKIYATWFLHDDLTIRYRRTKEEL